MKKGDRVEAKWAGSSKYYPATVLRKTPKHIEVEFEDGSVDMIKSSDVKPAEPDKKGIRKNRSRSRSVGRPRSRSPSPSRQSKDTSKPEKKTSNQKTKTSDTKSKTSDTKTRSSDAKSKTSDTKTRSSDTRNRSSDTKNRSSDKAESSDSRARTTESKYKTNHSAPSKEILVVDLDKVEFPASSSNSRTERVSYTEILEEYKTNKSEANVRTSARIAAKQVIRASESKDDAGLVNLPRKRMSSYSDEEDEEEEDKSEEDEVDTIVKRHPLKTFHFGSFVFVLLKILLPTLFILFFCLSCSKRACTIYGMPPLYNRWMDFLHDVKFPLLGLFLFHLSLIIFSKIPIGSQMSGYENVPKGILQRKYRLNGFYLLLLSLLSYAGAFYFEFYMNWGYEKIKPIVISSAIYMLVSSLFMHLYGLIKKKDSPEDKPHHRAGFLGDFYYGLETNPHIFGREDVKTRFIQMGLIGTVLLDFSILTKFFLMKNYLPIPLALSAAMHLFFIIDYFWREEHMLSTATYTDDGVGFGFIMSIGCILPSSFVMQTIFLTNQHAKAAHLPHWCSGAITLLFVCGYCLYNSASRLKHNFRKNPFSPSLSKVDSIPTSKQKRLITSGLFGIIRHPNYLGLILMAIAWSLPCGFTHALPYTPLLYLVLLLILRIWNVEGACMEKYGPAWQNYKEKVPKRLIPYIF